ncbi:MAG: hypothetical protein LBC04_00515 [Holosporaceae bacterium]|jgi:Flp pilus assembly pilin Flp|nr:hypothetical protein [Holosporaceae bacterium]
MRLFAKISDFLTRGGGDPLWQRRFQLFRYRNIDKFHQFFLRIFSFSWKKSWIQLRKKSSGATLVESALIITLVVVAAIGGLGYLGLAVQKQMSILAGATEGRDTSAGIGDSNDSNQSYSQCKELLLAFEKDSAHAEHGADRVQAFNDVWYNQIMNQYGNTLSNDDLHSLGRYAVEYILSDPPNASNKYKEHKQAMLGIYSSDDTVKNKLDAIRSYKYDEGIVDGQTEYSYIKEIHNVLANVLAKLYKT